MTYDAEGNTTKEGTEIPVIIKNPCVDPDFVTIEAAVFSDLDYTIGNDAMTYDSHEAFRVKTRTRYNLCGPLVYEPRYNGKPLTGQVLTYASDTRKFSVNSNDADLIGTSVPYSVIATFKNYPVGDYASAPTAENGADILFSNPYYNWEGPSVKNGLVTFESVGSAVLD